MTIDSIKAILINHAGSTQSLLFTLLMLVLWFGEDFISPQGRTWRSKWRHTSLNFLFVALVLPVQLVMTVFISMSCSWVVANHWGLIQLIPWHTNIWVRCIVLFLMLDFLDYVYHRFMHGVGGLWRFHRVHHCDQIMDVSTTVREHPGETFIRTVILIVWVFISGASMGILILRQTAGTIANITSHTHRRVPEPWGRILGWLFMTPNLHHVHHHYQLPHTDRNFGDVLSIWDRMFGTFSELSEEKTVFGLDTHMDEKRTSSFVSVAKMPFEGAWTDGGEVEAAG
jgi:sterol desaturase/sphingolipid hydroxylase (fatty acid hydroxylase superfamily)